MEKAILKFMSLIIVYFALPDSDKVELPYKLCDDPDSFSKNSSIQANVNAALSAISVANTTVSRGNGLDTVYASFLCYNYTSPASCDSCRAMAARDILDGDCSFKKTAIVWEENCQMRYSTERFFGELNVSGNFALNNKQNNSAPELFRSIVNQTLYNLTKIAAFNKSNRGYATGNARFVGDDTIYALVQCTLDLSPKQCSSCLEIAREEILQSFYFSLGARLLSRSCYLRYELYPFYGDTERSNRDPTSKPGLSKKWMIVLIAAATTLLLSALALAAYCLVQRYKKGNSNSDLVHRNNVDETSTLLQQKFPGMNNQELPHFDIRTIIEATDNFSDLNKLGEGGFGPVFKGKLPNGREIAVKRLLSNSEQGSEEFLNEVELILKLQHKNLVTLLGFCIHEDERLLVYEYMVNGSLDVFFSDRSKRAELDWSKRMNIINGIARGMLYLHVDSRLRIIHRDLKLSNVLLDADMTPKISDFGMARIFSGNDDRSNTSLIVGTFGYMAPEFAMEGLYSIKSDVFSFGVVLLEIITAKKNSAFHVYHNTTSLIGYAWKLWNEGRALELMDPCLKSSSNCDEEFLRCMQIGLLCVQEDPYDRPKMASIVFMLRGETHTLCQPKKPGFFVGSFPDHYETFNIDSTVNGQTVTILLPR